MMKHPSEEEFLAWRENPVTVWVMKACAQAAEDAKSAWVLRSWDAGECDPAFLIENRALATAYLDIIELNHADAMSAIDPPEDE